MAARSMSIAAAGQHQIQLEVALDDLQGRPHGHPSIADRPLSVAVTG
jgi:hypothetical protein